jgi:UDP-N-acetylglucosamine diphosphorylase / glucose-1-phosphate thymidylyltransferase / UDP-N-acetylgalactosamine diphosphorylase / glucosamine-1-phosphate N-acetyltransferase / galactosamine-1-phosphate N-acetyltransferase
LKAVILAAGKGTRMKDLAAARPKHLIPLDGKPVLEHVVTRLKEAGISEQVIVIGHLGAMIRDYFGDGSRFGIKIEYSVQEQLTGTGSALHAARAEASDGPFLTTFGDIVTPADTYRLLLREFQTAPSDALLLLNRVEDPYRGAAVYIEEAGRITQIVEKPPKGSSSTNWNQAGVFIFTPIIFEYIEKLAPSPRGEYELTQATAAMLGDGLNVRGCRLKGEWCDVGTPEDIAAAERIVSE